MHNKIECNTAIAHKKNQRTLIDLHCDTLSGLLKMDFQESIRQNHLQVNLEGMQKAGTMVQFFACFVNAASYNDVPNDIWDSAYQDVLKMAAKMEQETDDELRIARNIDEIQEHFKNGQISAILTVEEGGVLNGDLHRLEHLYAKGIRLITLTWNYENCIGYPNSPDPSKMKKLLKPFGLEVIHRMNELGMMIDVSHLSDGGFWDCIQYSQAPVVASHSNARALNNHPRNLSDDMLKALAEKGGIAGLNFYPAFLHKSNQEATVQDIARHAAYMIQTAGEDLPAIGTDFDGFDAPDITGYPSSVQEMELVYECMKRYGISERQLDKIWSGNAQRILREIL